MRPDHRHRRLLRAFEKGKAGAAKITVKDFDDPEARAMHDVDLDLSD